MQPKLATMSSLPSQSAILGMHAINERPLVVNGKIEARPMMYLALTYDHRLIDGREVGMRCDGSMHV
jgi:2-oxoglutarate dehydrogenase E2 component (dihydrolipoamide succinyltransferase)